MIGSITGIVREINENSIILDTQSGIGFIVFLTPSLLTSMKDGDTVSLLTYHHIREDNQTLYGFTSNNEKKLFHLLLSVPGIGPKTAFTIVSHISLDEAIEATQKNDSSVFSSISGIGKKTALKILLELSQKLKTEFIFEKELSEADNISIDALVSLGFNKREAQDMIKKLPDSLSIEQKIQEVLKKKVPKI